MSMTINNFFRVTYNYFLDPLYGAVAIGSGLLHALPPSVTKALPKMNSFGGFPVVVAKSMGVPNLMSVLLPVIFKVIESDEVKYKTVFHGIGSGAYRALCIAITYEALSKAVKEEEMDIEYTVELVVSAVVVELATHVILRKSETIKQWITGQLLEQRQTGDEEATRNIPLLEISDGRQRRNSNDGVT